MVRQQEQVTGPAAVMATLAMGLGSAVVVGDLRILSANISLIRTGLQLSNSMAIIVSAFFSSNDSSHEPAANSRCASACCGWLGRPG